MKLLDLYRSILAASGLETDKEGFVSIAGEEGKEPFFVDGKRTVLPTPEHMANPEKDKIVLFHPLFEYVTRAESSVMAAYRRQLGEHLSNSFMAAGLELLTIASSQKMHASLNPEQLEFLSNVPDADEQMFHTWVKLIGAMPPGQNQKTFCSIYLRRGGKFQDKVHQRVAVVNFPLYQQLVKDGQEREAAMEARKSVKKDAKEKLAAIPNETWGVKLRAVDRQAFIKLIEYMVPGIADEQTYWAASNSQIAPNIDAVMHAAELIGGALNALVDRFESAGSIFPKLRMEDAWVPDFVNLAPLQVEIRMIPMQQGNEGGVAKAAATAAEAEAIAREAQGAVTPPGKVEAVGVAAPVAAPAAVAEEEERAPAGFRLPHARQAPQAPVQAPHVPQQYQGGYPQQTPSVAYATTPGYQQGYQQPAPYQAPVQQHHQGGVTFQDALRSNPALAGMAMQAQYQQGYPQPQPQREAPIWPPVDNGYGNVPQQQGPYRSKF